MNAAKKGQSWEEGKKLRYGQSAISAKLAQTQPRPCRRCRGAVSTPPYTFLGCLAQVGPQYIFILSCSILTST